MGRQRSGQAKDEGGARRAKGRKPRSNKNANKPEEQEMASDFEEPVDLTEEPAGSELTTEEKPKKVKRSVRQSRKPRPVRMRLVWGVFSSSVQCVQTFPYSQKKEAEALAAKLTSEKKSLFFVQPIREAITEELAP